MQPPLRAWVGTRLAREPPSANSHAIRKLDDSRTHLPRHSSCSQGEDASASSAFARERLASCLASPRLASPRLVSKQERSLQQVQRLPQVFDGHILAAGDRPNPELKPARPAGRRPQGSARRRSGRPRRVSGICALRRAALRVALKPRCRPRCPARRPAAPGAPECRESASRAAPGSQGSHEIETGPFPPKAATPTTQAAVTTVVCRSPRSTIATVLSVGW